MIKGRSLAQTHALALGQISRMVAHQASLLSSIAGLQYLIGVAVCGGIFAAWQKQID